MIGGDTIWRLGKPLESGGVNVLSVDLDETVAEVLSNQRERLLESVEPNASAIPLNTHCLVLTLKPSGAESEFQAAAGEEVESRQLLREHHRLAIIDAEHSGSDTDRGRSLR